MKQLWAHQAACLEWSKDKTGMALLMPIGVGKTLTAIKILEDKYTQMGSIQRTVIFGTPSILHAWKREVLSEMQGVHSDQVLLADSSVRAKKHFQQLAENAKIIITNYEALTSEKSLRVLQGFGAKVLVADESTKIKSYGSKRTKAIFTLSKQAKVKIALTGTPVTQTYGDLWSQFKFFDDGESFGTNYFEFRKRYFYDDNAGKRWFKFPSWKVKKESIPFFESKLAEKGFSVDKSKCIDLPDYVQETLEVELTSTQRKAYEEIKTDLVTILGENVIAADLAIVKLIRMLQICSGHVKGDSGVVLFDDNPKVEALSDLLEGIIDSSKVIIWASFTEDYKAIEKLLKKLNIKYVKITGQENTKQKAESEVSFQTDPEVRVIICNQKSASHGLTLTAADTAIYFSKSYSAEEDIQSAGRNYRGGSEVHSKITRVDIVCKDTVEENIMARLAEKHEMGNKSILAALKEDFL